MRHPLGTVSVSTYTGQLREGGGECRGTGKGKNKDEDLMEREMRKREISFPCPELDVLKLRERERQSASHIRKGPKPERIVLLNNMAE